MAVAAYAAAQDANPQPWLRHRVHHAYFPTPRALELMARHQIGAATSNPFLVYLAESFVTSLGAERVHARDADAHLPRPRHAAGRLVGHAGLRPQPVDGHLRGLRPAHGAGPRARSGAAADGRRGAASYTNARRLDHRPRATSARSSRASAPIS